MEFLSRRGEACKPIARGLYRVTSTVVRLVQGKLCFSYTPNVATAAMVSKGLLIEPAAVQMAVMDENYKLSKYNAQSTMHIQ
ncbi:Protein of unknown function [Gryllus bimaculatus]|nr:Protein of unknown function [Gryllus bimaculatus]